MGLCSIDVTSGSPTGTLGNEPVTQPCPSGFWVAVQVRPQREQFVAEQLRSKGYEEFLPTCRALARSERARTGRSEAPLFAGYLFCRYTQRNGGGPLIVTTPGVIRILSGCGKPVPVSDDEIAALRNITGSGLEYCRSPYLQAGQLVRIASGPLSGITGVLSRTVGRDRLVVCVNILRRGVAVQVDARNVIPVARDGVDAGF